MGGQEKPSFILQKKKKKKRKTIFVSGLACSVVCGSNRSDCLGLDCHTVGLAENIGSALLTEDNIVA